jgi:4-hydroxybenzoyl-CoA reductase subunit beta
LLRRGIKNMGLPKFDYFEPRSLDEALSLMSGNSGDTCVVGGGTELYVQMKQRLLARSKVVSLAKVPDMDKVYSGETGLTIGPAVTQSVLGVEAMIPPAYRGLAEAAGSVASPQIRNVATIGGNACLNTRCWYYNQSSQWRRSRPRCFKRGGDYCYVVNAEGGGRCFALFMADTAIMLTALGASVLLKSSGGSRLVQLKDFYTGKGEKPNQLMPSEILAEIRVPLLPAGSGSAYVRHADRAAIDFASLSVGISVTVEPKTNVCRHIAISVGGVGPKPFIAGEAADILTGKELTDDLVDEACLLTAKGAKPVTHMAVPAHHKRRIIPVYVKRALKKALDLAHSA